MNGSKEDLSTQQQLTNSIKHLDSYEIAQALNKTHENPLQAPAALELDNSHLVTVMTDSMNMDESDIYLEPTLPPDGGWGWVIVFGSFLCMALVDGVCFSYGIFLTEIEEAFQTSKTKMSLAGSLLTGCYLLMGPIASALENQMGSRIVMVAGTVISTLAIFSSAFIYNFDLFIAIFGVIGGIGYGLVFLPASTSVSIWFHRRRATATGIAVCGSGIGSAIYGLVLPPLIRYYTWRGCIILLAAINLHCAIAGVLFRPITPEDRVTQSSFNQAKNSKTKDKQQQQHGSSSVEQCSLFDATIRNKAYDLAISTGSLNGKIINMDNKVVPEPPNYTDQAIISHQAINHIINSYLTRKESNPGNDKRVRSLYSLHERTRLNSRSLTQSLASITKQSNIINANNLIDINNIPLDGRDSTESLPMIDQEAKMEIVQKLQKEINRPMNKKDLFYSGSTLHLHEFVSNADDVRSFVRSVTNIVNEEDTKNPTKSALKKLFQLHILKSPTFLLLALSSVFSMLGFFIPFQFLKDNAEHNGFSSEWSAFLLSIIGITNTIGRVISGLLSDQPWCDCLWINNVALFVAGGSTMLVPFCYSYSFLALYAAVFGLFIAAFVSLRTILVVELIGLDQLTNAYGFLLLFQGCAVVAGPPLLGSFYDAMQVYDYTFYLGGLSLVISAVLCLPLRMLAIKERRSNEKRGEIAT